MRHSPHSLLRACIVIAILWVAGCSSGGDKVREEPIEAADLSGVWVGWFDARLSPLVFSIGIIVEEPNGYVARFIGDGMQYLSPVLGFYGDVFPFDVQPLAVTSGSGFFFGDLAGYSWPGGGGEYEAYVEKLYLSGTVASKDALGIPGGGAFRYYDDNGELTDNTGAFLFIYNTTYDVSPNVQNLGGNWEIRNAWQDANTLNLTITPDPVETNTMGGIISGSDSLGNVFAGSIVIHYSPIPHNVYDVTLRMNNTINLDGLATYVLEMDESGIEIKNRTLAIGVTSSDYSHAVGGLATPR